MNSSDSEFDRLTSIFFGMFFGGVIGAATAHSIGCYWWLSGALSLFNAVVFGVLFGRFQKLSTCLINILAYWFFFPVILLIDDKWFRSPNQRRNSEGQSVDNGE